MILPATPILPDFTAAPPDVLASFGSASLAGLGCGCSEYDDSGNCLDPESCSSSDPIPITTSPTPDNLQLALNDLNSSTQCGPNAGGGISCGSGANAVDIPPSTVATYANFPTSSSAYYRDGSGNVIVPMANGAGYYTVTPSGTLTQTTAAQPPAKAAPYSSSAASAAQAAQIQNAITQAGRVAQILALSPGETVLPNGTITHASTGGTIGGISTTTLLMMGLAVFGVMLMSEGRR